MQWMLTEHQLRGLHRSHNPDIVSFAAYAAPARLTPLPHPLQRLLPAGTELPRALNPAAVHNLPSEIRLDYLDAFGSAIHAAFLMAACIMAVAFLLSWLLKEAPLKKVAN